MIATADMLPNTLKRLRLASGLSQAELARRCRGVSAQTLSDYENGHKVPTLLMLERIMLPLGYKVGFSLEKLEQ